MIINRVDFPIYDFFIYSSIILGAIYVYVSLNKDDISKKRLLCFFILFITLAITGGKLYNYIEGGFKGNIITNGVTGYGGLIGSILSAVIYKIIYKDDRFIKYTIISLPLMYSFAKLACFTVGCCYGIPYNGLFAVKYPHIMDKYLFPIQLVETISFIIVFLICNTLNKKDNISYITLIIVFITKFLLDFLRYSHIKEPISNNQVMSIILLLITLTVYFYNKKKYLKN